MVLLVKNMVCHRCLLAVEDILRQHTVQYKEIIVGEIHFDSPLPALQHAQLAADFQRIGLELISKPNGGLAEKIKQLLLRKARNEVPDTEKQWNLSVYLSRKLHHEYTYLSSLFTRVEGRTIENYFIAQRIEKAKELLVYNEMTLLSISVELEYSSVAHLSTQFKKVTGLSPSHFRKIGAAKRKLIENV